MDSERPVVDEALVRKTARLARLKVSDEEIPGLVDHLEKILDLVDTLRSVKIPDGHPIVEHQSAGQLSQLTVSVTREDQTAQPTDAGGPRDAAAFGANAPDWRDGSFVTPRVVG
ncbi:MAG: aspartyl/glutamyl-tRNA amidotransferase subunit C [Planctomycetota bacterium]|nr:aspartyl/glutamyl-tRNA amidotransferase subunit C [Planctomycetota bacterium]